MHRHVWLLVVIAAAGLLAACGPSVNVEQEKSALLAVDKEWSQAAKDVDKFVSFMAPNATSYGPGIPASVGSAAIRTQMTEMLKAPGIVIAWAANKADVSAAGDIGYTAGTTSVTINNAAGNAVTEKGKYVTIWKKQADGQWKAVEDIFNADTPPPLSSPHVMAAAGSLKWGDAPPSLPPGAKLAVISGDPTKAEPFTMRAQLPAGYRIAPHWHPTDEHLTALSGTFAIGMGDTFDAASLKDVSAGGYVALPGTMHHYFLAKTAVTFQVHGMGPFVVNYVNAADDPSKK